MAFVLKPPHLTPKSNRFNGVHLIFGQFAASNLLNQRKIYGNISHIWSQCQVFKGFLRYIKLPRRNHRVIGVSRVPSGLQPGQKAPTPQHGTHLLGRLSL